MRAVQLLACAGLLGGARAQGGHVKKQCTLHNTTSEAIDVARKVYELRSRLGDMYESVGMPRPVLKASGEGMQLPGYPTGGGCHDVNLELFVRLAARMPDTRQIVIIGNAFGLSTIALSFLFPRARVDAIDAEKEGAGNARGSKVTADIAQRHGLNVHVHAPFFSPWDVPRALAHLGPGSVDLAFIDGLHTDEQQYMDFTVLQPYMRANGNFAMVFDDVYMTMLWKSLELIRLLLPVGSGMRVHEYRPLNICNSFGTHVATTHADLGVKREFGAPAWAKPVGYHGTSMHSRMGA